MAIIDTHKAFERLSKAGFDKAMAEALLETMGESHDALATKSDIHALQQAMSKHATKADIADMATKADIADMATKADIADMATKADIADMATKADIADMATKADLRELELRIKHDLTLRLGGLVVGAAAVLAMLELVGR